MGEDNLPWFKFYPSDFMGSGKVQMMGPVERGIYISLLCWSWQEGPIPDDPKIVARLAGADADEMDEAWPLVRAAFTETDDGMLIHERLEKERAAALKRRERASKAAQAKQAQRAASSAEGTAEGSAASSAAGGATRAPDSEAQNSVVSDVQKNSSSEDVKSSGPEPAVENPPWNERLAPLVRDVAFNGRGPPEGQTVGRSLSKAKQLIDGGYDVDDLEDAIRGLRQMAEDRHRAVGEWLGPDDRFTVLAFGRAEEKGQKLLQRAAHYWRKNGDHADIELEASA